ncbi:phage tail spike protein [Streptococcus ruminantium]|uniref:phage tail spike protein n=1 Tax=Streptococcus ruminantium TaxID=1917441 RepID=UPI0012DE48F7|nr:phage tail spike protein [Streptococcus ruminantium]
MISVFPSTAYTTKELAGVGYPILDPWCKSAKLYIKQNGHQYIKLVIPHHAKGVDIALLPKELQIIKIHDMDGDEDYYRVRKPQIDLKYTTIYAEHLTYDLNDNLIEDVYIVNSDGQQAMDKISKSTQYPHPFKLRSDIEGVKNLRLVRVNPMQAILGNADNTFINRYGGELKRQGFTISVNKRIGVNRTDVIRSGKNLTGFESSYDFDDVATRIMPKGPNGILLPEKYVDSPIINHYPLPFIKVIDYKVEYEGNFDDLPQNEKERVYNELRTLAKADFEAGIDVPKATYKVNFVALRNTIEYKEYEALENIGIGDLQPVHESRYDIFIKGRVVDIVWDLLNEKHDSITLGNFQNGIVQSTIATQKIVEEQVREAQETANLALKSADGKTTNYYGEVEPSNPSEGDLWYKKNGQEDEMWQYQLVNGKMQWVYVTGTLHATELESRIVKQVYQLKRTVDKSVEEQNQQIADILRIADISTDARKLIEEAKSELDQSKSDLTELVNTAAAKASQAEESIGLLRSEMSGRNSSIESNLAGITEKFGNLQIGATNLFSLSGTTKGFYKFNKGESIASARYAHGEPLAVDSGATYILQTWSKSINDFSWIGAIQLDSEGRVIENSYLTIYPSKTSLYFKRDISILPKAKYIQFSFSDDVFGEDPNLKVQFEKGTIPTDYHLPDMDLQSQVAAYKRTAEENSAELIRQLNMLDGKTEQYKTAVEQTANSLRTRLESLETYQSDEGKRVNQYFTAMREETARQIAAERTAVANGYVSKSKYEEDVRGITQRFEAQQSYTDTKIAEYKQTVEGRFATLQAEKADQVAFQKVQETVNLYQRVIGDGTSISETIQTAKGLVTRVSNLIDGQNLVYDPTNFSKYRSRPGGAQLAMIGTDKYKMIRITQTGQTSHTWGGFQMPLHSQKFVEGEKLSYRVNLWVDVVPDDIIGFEIKSGTAIAGFSARPTKVGNNQIFTGTFTVHRTVTVTDDFGLHVWLRKNGSVAIGQISIVRGEVPPTSFVDSTSAMQLATETQVSALAGSWAVRNLTSAGTVLNQINALANGNNRIDGRLTHITGQTLIDDAVITSAKIADMDAGKIKTGTLDAANVNIVNLNVNKLVGLDANFIKSKIELAIIDWMKGKTIVAQNNGMTINLNSSDISFHNAQAAIKRQKNGVTGYLNFQDDRYGGVYAALGVTSHSVGIVAEGATNYGKFAGVEVYRSNDSVDKIRIVGDRVEVTHGANASAFIFRPANMERGADVDMNNIVNAVRALSMSIHHLAANNFIFTQGVKDQINRLRSYMNGIGETYL